MMPTTLLSVKGEIIEKTEKKNQSGIGGTLLIAFDVKESNGTVTATKTLLYQTIDAKELDLLKTGETVTITFEK